MADHDTQAISNAAIPKKKLMVLNRKAPYGTADANDALEFALLAATFDQQVCLVFLDDGILQLLANQNPQAIAMKNFSTIFKTLDLYDIADVYIEKESMTKRHIQASELLIPCQIVSAAQLQTIMQQYDVIVSL